VEHPPVLYPGSGGKPEHLIAERPFPSSPSTTAGQADHLSRAGAGGGLCAGRPRGGLRIRELVSRMEQAVIDLLAIRGESRTAGRVRPACRRWRENRRAGMRVKQGCTYHGLAFNVDLIWRHCRHQSVW